MGGKTTTISTSEPRLGGLRLQTSQYGLTWGLGFGRYRAPGNLIWYNNFRSVATTEVSESGGKGGGGGGVRQERTTYKYYADLIMALGHGIIPNVVSVWKGKKRLQGYVIPETQVNETATATLGASKQTSVTGYVSTGTVWVVNGDYVWVGDSSDAGGSYQFVDRVTSDFTVSNGTYTFGASVDVGQTVRIEYVRNIPQSSVSALGELGAGLAVGSYGQPPVPFVQTSFPGEALGYSGLAYIYAQSYELSANAEVMNHSFELSTTTEFSASIVDANPRVVIDKFLTDPYAGALWPSWRLGDLTHYENYCVAHGIFFSPFLLEQKPANEILNNWLMLTNSDVLWSEGKLKFLPRGDAPKTGNGKTYTPNTTPVFDLTDDDFLSEGSATVLKIRRKENDEAYNVVTLEIENRVNQYNVEPVRASDLAHIERFGQRPKETLEAKAIKDPQVASFVATLLLQREIAVRNEYEFRLSWVKDGLEPGDLVTLTYAPALLDRVPARIVSMDESDEGTWSVVAEDAPIGMASAPLYGVQAGSGFAHDYNKAPGNVATPVFFEAPIERTTSGLQVYVAVTGTISAWGGCSVWVSLDDVNYKRVDTINTPARYGTLRASLASGVGATAQVQLTGLGGQLLPGTAPEADTDATLCWVGNATGGEYFSHEGAAFVGTNQYDLSGLRRGRFGSPALARTAGSSFVRVDDAVGSSGDLDLSLVDKTLYFKFTSFNVYGGGEQALADVPVYSYKITGSMLKLPPSAPTGLTLQIETNGVRAKWNPCPDQDYASTLVKQGASWDSAVLLSDKSASTHLLDWQPAGVCTVWAAHVDQYGNISTPVSTAITIRPPLQVVMTATEMQANALVMQWLDAKTDQPILRYQYRMGVIGTPYASAMDWGSAGSDGRSDLRTFRTPGEKVVYVVAYDLAGNASTPTSFVVTSNMPTDFVIATEWWEDWQTSELVNTSIIGGANGRLLMPVKERTWAQHFADQSWANIQAQINAGFPLYWQPAETSGHHIERKDCGTLISGGVISVSVTDAMLGTGAVSTVSIRTSADAVTWSAWTDTRQLQASNFRWVEVRYAVTCPGRAGAMLVEDIYVDVRLQQLIETATLTLNAADVGGTFYPVTKPFIDIKNVQVTALNSPSLAVFNAIIQDSTTPFGVYVQAWNLSNVRVSGTVSLTITGV